MSFLFLKNPKITHKDKSLKEYLEDSETKDSYSKTKILSFMITKRHNDMFRIYSSLEKTHLTIDGCLLTDPVCSKPKSGFFWGHYYEKYKTQLILTTKKYDLDDFNKQTNLTAKKLGVQNRYLWGKFYFKPTIRGMDYHLGLDIHNSHSKFLQFFYERITAGEEVAFKICVQKIENISFFPIIDLFFRDMDYEEISKTLGTTSSPIFPSASYKLIF
jgi:hypothetical protein|tara:strand:- start:106 stop:753 length:648 start_codon:yes stop_codon:yes gene_type:complete